MAKITALDIADRLTGEEFLPIVQGPATKRVTMSAFRSLITPFLQYWYKGDRGDTGPANSTYPDIEALKAADHTNLSFTLITDDGPVDYIYVENDFTSKADDINVIELDAVAISQGALIRETSAAISHRRPGTPGILDVSKAIDALGVHPLMFGWSGELKHDASDYYQKTVDYCNLGVQAPTTPSVVTAAFAQAMFCPYPARISKPIVVPNRKVDHTNGRFQINGCGGTGVIIQEGNFVLFQSSTPDLPPDEDGDLSPDTEYVLFKDMRFINRDRNNTGSTISEKFLRITFDACEFLQMPCMIGSRYSQEWWFINTICRALPNNRAFFESHGAFAIRAIMAKFQFSWESAAGAFLLGHPTANKAVDSCSFDYSSFETHSGPFLRACQIEGSGVSRLYAENPSGPVIDLRCPDNGSRNDGFQIVNSKLQATKSNQANPAFGNILVGPGGLKGDSNASRGGLYDNAPEVVTERGLNLRKGHAFGELISNGDRLKTTGKMFQQDVEGQRLIPADPDLTPGNDGWMYARRIVASTVLVDPINGVAEHAIPLPDPIPGRRVRVRNIRSAPTDRFTLMPGESKNGSAFRGGAQNAGLIQAPGADKHFFCIERGIWDGD